MTWHDAADAREKERRIDAAIARASACLMSDAKWRKLFETLHLLGVGPLRWKFVGNERIFEAFAPPALGLLERMLGDVLPYPYGPYREIEWVEIPAKCAERTVEALNSLGRFPIQETETGLRVVGYAW